MNFGEREEENKKRVTEYTIYDVDSGCDDGGDDARVAVR